MSQQKNGRRAFIAKGSAAAVATIVPRHVLGDPGFVAPSDKVNVGIIGAGGQGRTNTRALLQEEDCQVIALADPAEDWDLGAFYYGGRAGRGPVRSEIETAYAAKATDHLHAYATIHAMKAGKHVYCEKPLTHNVWEGRQEVRGHRARALRAQLGPVAGPSQPPSLRPRLCLVQLAPLLGVTGTTGACAHRLRPRSTTRIRDSGSARRTTASFSSASAGTSPARLVGNARSAATRKEPRVRSPREDIARVDGHHADWLQACKGCRPACSNFSYAARLSEFILLGNVALRTGRRLAWDAPGMKATNAPEADQYLREDYRAGWEMPALA